MRFARNIALIFLATVSVLLAGEHATSAPNWWDQLGELPATNSPIAEVIDNAICEKIADANLESAPKASDETLLRRVTLDLVGRIPTLVEQSAFAADSSDGRWAKTVDRLLGSPGFVRNQTNELNWLLRDGKSSDFRNKYLLTALQEDRRWNEIFKDVVLAQATEEKKGVEEFMRDQIRDLDKLTTAVSVRFFGVDISCAQCHDHPYVGNWTQDTYFGMQSFFSRSFDNGGFIAEREYGMVSFKTVKGEERNASLSFLGSDAISEPAEIDGEARKEEKKRLDEFKKEKKQAPLPRYSRRAVLVEQGLTGGRDFLARAMVNQTWNRFFGRGLVMPLDQMHGQNAPSHPELLQWLANDLKAHDFDLRRLIRGIVLSEAWQRGSVWEGDRPVAEFFAVAEPRPLTPRQYGVSLIFALSDPNAFAPERDAAEIEKQVENYERSGEGLAGNFDRPTENFHVAVGEALYFSNSEDLAKRIRSSRLFGRLKALKTPEEQLDLAIRSILARKPAAEESSSLAQYLAERENRSDQAMEQIIWALLTSSEARFNH